MGQRSTTPRLAAADLAVLVEAVLLLPLVALGLRLFGFEPLRTQLARRADPSRRERPADCLRAALRIARVVRIAASRGPFRARCLPKSLLLWWLLRRRGMQPALRLGVQRDASGIRAHAWVELHGLVLSDHAGNIAGDYAPFERDVGAGLANAR
jgi:hypothetical protein